MSLGSPFGALVPDFREAEIADLLSAATTSHHGWRSTCSSPFFLTSLNSDSVDSPPRFRHRQAVVGLQPGGGLEDAVAFALGGISLSPFEDTHDAAFLQGFAEPPGQFLYNTETVAQARIHQAASVGRMMYHQGPSLGMPDQASTAVEAPVGSRRSMHTDTQTSSQPFLYTGALAACLCLPCLVLCPLHSTCGCNKRTNLAPLSIDVPVNMPAQSHTTSRPLECPEHYIHASVRFCNGTVSHFCATPLNASTHVGRRDPQVVSLQSPCARQN
jgi:hypothetical protein